MSSEPPRRESFRHRSLQYFTSCQFLSHFLRHVICFPHCAQSFARFIAPLSITLYSSAAPPASFVDFVAARLPRPRICSEGSRLLDATTVPRETSGGRCCRPQTGRSHRKTRRQCIRLSMHFPRRFTVPRVSAKIDHYNSTLSASRQRGWFRPLRKSLNRVLVLRCGLLHVVRCGLLSPRV